MRDAAGGKGGAALAWTAPAGTGALCSLRPPQSSPWVNVRLRRAVAGTLWTTAGFENATPVPAWIAKTLVRGAGAGLERP